VGTDDVIRPGAEVVTRAGVVKRRGFRSFNFGIHCVESRKIEGSAKEKNFALREERKKNKMTRKE